MTENRCEIRVRYAETDQMGVVYHSNYFIWFEVGRTTLLREMGYSYKKMEKENILLPVVKVECNYKVPARYDDVIIVDTKISEVKGVRITFDYKLYRKEDQQLLATGKTIHAFVNKEMKPVNIQKYLPDVFEKFIPKG